MSWVGTITSPRGFPGACPDINRLLTLRVGERKSNDLVADGAVSCHVRSGLEIMRSSEGSVMAPQRSLVDRLSPLEISGPRQRSHRVWTSFAYSEVSRRGLLRAVGLISPNRRARSVNV